MYVKMPKRGKRGLGISMPENGRDVSIVMDSSTDHLTAWIRAAENEATVAPGLDDTARSFVDGMGGAASATSVSSALLVSGVVGHSQCATTTI